MEKTTTKPDYFMQDKTGKFAGLHVILDLYKSIGLDSPTFVNDGLIEAAKAANATILHSHVHHFGEASGVSGVVVLAESHISVHTWPEHQYAAFDVFMCGNTDPDKAIAHLIDHFQSQQPKIRKIRRGDMIYANLDQ